MKNTKKDPVVYIDGIASCEAIDTAAEVVSLQGLDCSTLVGGAFNWEHKNSEPSQIIGKILKSKKIFSEKDCEDDRQLMYWNHCKIPFLYVMGRLFNDKKESSKEVAALFIDDYEHPNETPMVGFSIEGSKINKEGMTVTHALARKVTVTTNPANKLCIARLIPAKKEQSKDILESIFKSESVEISIDLKKSELKKNTLAPKQPVAPKTPTTPTTPKAPVAPKTAVAPKTSLQGTSLGRTSSGHDIFVNAKVGDYGHFSAADHTDAYNAHFNAAQQAKDFKTRQFHTDKARLHAGRRDTLQRLDEKRKAQLADTRASRATTNVSVSGNINVPTSSKNKLFDPRLSRSLNKTMTAGSGISAPSSKTGGAALAKEDVLTNTIAADRTKRLHSYNQRGDKQNAAIARDGAISARKERLSNLQAQKKPNITKSELLIKAEEKYSIWSKKEDFRKFMQDNFPNLTMSEIDAIGKAVLLSITLSSPDIT
jgi:hypothetical protein